MNYHFRCFNDHTCCFSVASLIRHAAFSHQLRCCNDHTYCFSVASLIRHAAFSLFINQIKCMLFPTSMFHYPMFWTDIRQDGINSRKCNKNLENYLCLCRRSCVQNLRWFRGGQRNLNLRNVLQMSSQARVNNPFVIKFFWTYSKWAKCFY